MRYRTELNLFNTKTLQLLLFVHYLLEMQSCDNCALNENLILPGPCRQINAIKDYFLNQRT